MLFVQRRPWHDKKANRRDKGTIGAKTCFQKMLCPTPVEVQKLRFMIKNGMCLYLELCFLCKRREAYFQEFGFMSHGNIAKLEGSMEKS